MPLTGPGDALRVAKRRAPQRAARRVLTTPVQRWFPGRGSAFTAPPAGVFYSSRVRARAHWWKQAGAPRMTLACLVDGVKIQFHSPLQPFLTSPLLVAPEDVNFALEDLAKGDRLGAYQPLLPSGRDFLSRTRVDTRPGSGKKRVVHNYKKVNDHAVKRTCRYEQVKDLHRLLRPQDWMLSWDVSSAFWTVPLHVDTAHFLSFHFALPAVITKDDGAVEHVPLQPGAYWVTGQNGFRYQVVERSCRSIPFGYTNSPFVWTKVYRVIAKALRRLGVRCLFFVDDALCALPSRAEALRTRALIEEMFARSGLQRAPDKGVWEPTQTLPDHLGFEISTATRQGHLRVPPRRCKDITRAAKDLMARSARNARRVSSDLLRSFLGKASSVKDGCSQTGLRTRALHDVCEQWTGLSKLDRAALRDLQWWTDFHYECSANGVPLWPEAPSRAIYTDASSTLGYGAVLSAPQGARKTTGGYWQTDEKLLWHITMKELVAVRRGITTFAADLQGRVVTLWEDNQAVIFIIRNKTSRSPLLMAELRLLLELLDELHIDLRPRYIRSALNPADEFSRLTERDAWELRPRLRKQLLAKAECVMNFAPSLDPFACAQTHICPRYAARHSDSAALCLDGLSLSWRHEDVWINPPWCLIPDIIEKLEDEPSAAAVFIVPVWPSQQWWPRLLALGGTHLHLSRPKMAIHALHDRMVEPFLHPSTRLLAVLLPRGIRQSAGASSATISTRDARSCAKPRSS